MPDEFNFPFPRLPGHSKMTERERMEMDNIANFNNHVSIITNMMVGGKLSPKVGYKRIKKWYKLFKKTHKVIKGKKNG